MRRIIAALVDRPIGTALVLVAVVGLGVLSALRLPLSALPAVGRPTVRVEGKVAGAGMERLDQTLARRLEDRLLVLPGCDDVTVWSRDGVVAAEAAFRWGVTAEQARLAVTEAVDGLNEVDVQTEWRVALTWGRPALVVLLAGAKPLADRSTLVENVLVPAFSAIPGIARVEQLGSAPLRTVVRPLPARLAASDLTPADLRAVLRQRLSVQQVGAAHIAGDIVDIVAVGAGTTPAEVAAIEIPGPRGVTLRLSDLAEVREAPWPEHGQLALAGTPAVGVALHLQPDANALDVGRRLDRTFANLAGRLPAGLTLERHTDALAELRQAVRGLLVAGLAGALVAGLVLALLIRRVAPLGVQLAAIPLSLAAALPAFEALGIGLNLVSLAGIAMATGMLVDASTVVLESCLGRSGTGRTRAIEGTAAVTRAIIAAAVTTAVVFIPALYLHHLAAAFYRQLAIAVMLTVLTSMAFALLVVPVVAARLQSGRPRRESGFERGYRRLLTRVLARPVWAPVVSLLAVFGIIATLRGAPQQLLVPEQSSAVELSFVLPATRPGSDLPPGIAAVTAALRRPGERDLLAVGLAPTSGPPLPWGFWRLGEPRTPAELERLRVALENATPGLVVRSAGPVGGVLDAVPLRRLTVEVRGEDRAAVGASALQVAAGLQRAGLPVLALLPPRVSTLEARPTELGWRHGALLPSLIEAALPAADGVAIGQIRVDESALATRDPGEIEIRWRELRAPLSSFANLVAVERPAVLERRGGQPVVQLTVGEATADVSRLASLLVEFRTGLASSVAVRASGGVLDWIEARSELVLAFVLGLLLVFLVVMGVYESFRFAAAIMAVLPIAVLGGLVAQRVAGAGLDLGAGLGFVLLGGMAVDSGVLLLDRMRGCEAGPAWMARRAAGRLRPVAVTTLTTVATMAPVALAGGAGSSLRVTLARTACAGLLLAIPTNLLVLPALARLLGGLRGNAEGPSS